MFSNIFLNKNNLIYNARTLREIAEKKLCAMVKANAYGHGAKEIASLLDEEVDFFGVSNLNEALEIKPYVTRPIIVFGKCSDYEKCINNEISFILLSFEQAKEIIKLGKILGKTPRMHLCINSGMNRYGVREKKEFIKIIKLLSRNNLELEGLYTHFSSLTTDEKYTLAQYNIFQEYCSLLPKAWNTITHIGGGGTIFTEMQADMNRVGLEFYGYGKPLVKPVLSVESTIVDIVKVKKGEHIGYLCGYTAQSDMIVATVPLGYGDGFPRKLSNKLEVKVGGKIVKNVGNICMDAFMIDVTNVKCKVGDKVTILDNASPIASLLETTEYEVLTNLSKFRGERKIVE